MHHIKYLYDIAHSQKLVFLLSILLKLIIPPVYATEEVTPKYKHWDDFIIVRPAASMAKFPYRFHYIAQEKLNDRETNSMYKDNRWHLVQRDGLYFAQVDKAMSELYKHFLGYSTDVDIVIKDNDYYIARRDFANFKKWNLAMQKQNDFYLIDGYILKPDGNVEKNGQIKKFTGLGSFAALTDFLANTDIGLSRDYPNYGVQEGGDEIRVIVYDNDKSFDFDGDINEDSQNSMERSLDESLKNSSWYLQEKQAMLQKIAETDFSVFEKIIRNNITTSLLDSYRWSCDKYLSGSLPLDQTSPSEILEECDKINTMNEKQYNVDHIVNVLQERHTDLRRRMGID